jgi:hypothetical protein
MRRPWRWRVVNCQTTARLLSSRHGRVLLRSTGEDLTIAGRVKLAGNANAASGFRDKNKERYGIDELRDCLKPTLLH